MRVSPIGITYSAQCRNKAVRVREIPAPQEPLSFKGGKLKFGDYVVGAVCGTAMAAVGFAIGGPLGAIALGAIGAKTTAEANNETRPYNPDDKKDN